MPYTPPAGNAADFTFPGRLYAPRMGDDARFSWDTTTPIAAPITSTRFGWPTLPQSINSTRFGMPSLRLLAEPASTGAVFGDPRRADVIGTATSIGLITAFGTAYVPNNATGFSSTQFGTPNSPYTQTGIADGFQSTMLGEHRVIQVCYAFAAVPSTVVSMAYTPVNQTAEVSAFNPSTQFGTPLGSRRRSGAFRRLCQASGFFSGEFGLHSAVVAQAAGASSINSTAFGTPTARGRWMVRGFMSTRMGAWHRAKQVTGGSYVTGFASGALGTPSALIANRVSAMPPATLFGTPLLQRSTTC